MIMEPTFLCSHCHSDNYTVKRRHSGPIGKTGDGTGAFKFHITFNGERSLIHCVDCGHEDWVDGWIGGVPPEKQRVIEYAERQRAMVAR